MVNASLDVLTTNFDKFKMVLIQYPYILLTCIIIFCMSQASPDAWAPFSTLFTSTFLQWVSINSSAIFISGSHVLKGSILKWAVFGQSGRSAKLDGPEIQSQTVFHKNTHFLIFWKLIFALSQVSISQKLSISALVLIIAVRSFKLKFFITTFLVVRLQPIEQSYTVTRGQMLTLTANPVWWIISGVTVFRQFALQICKLCNMKLMLTLQLIDE